MKKLVCALLLVGLVIAGTGCIVVPAGHRNHYGGGYDRGYYHRGHHHQHHHSSYCPPSGGGLRSHRH